MRSAALEEAEAARDEAQAELVKSAKLTQQAEKRLRKAETLATERAAEVRALEQKAESADALAAEVEEGRRRENALEARAASAEGALADADEKCEIAADAAKAALLAKTAAEEAASSAKAAVDASAAKVTSLEAQLADARREIESAENASKSESESRLSDLSSRVAALEGMVTQAEGERDVARAAVTEANESLESYRAKARAMMEEKDAALDQLRRKAERLEYSAPAPEPTPVLAPEPTPVLAPEPEPEPEPVFVPPALDALDADDDAKMTYLKNVVIKLLCTDDWEQQDALVPILGAVLGFTLDDSKSIKDRRSEIAPLVVKLEEGLRYVGLIGDTTAKTNPPPASLDPA
jgi:hypothetical protein